MDNIEFLLLLNQKFELFICTLILNSILIYLLRKRMYNILDPLFLQIITAVCANSVPLFLYIEGYISHEKITFIFLSEFLFWLGFYHRSQRGMTPNFITNTIYTSNTILEKKVFWIFFYFLTFSNLFIFSTNGIPLFSTSRFEIFQGNIFSVLVNRLSIIPEFYCYIYIYNQIRKKNYNTVLPLLILVSIKLLYGSKSFILNCVYAYFFYSLYYLKRKPQIRKKYLLVIVISPIITITAYYGIENFKEAFMFLLFRFVASGDGYWQGFSYDLIDDINGPTYAFERIFSFILGPLGLIHTEAKIPLGTLILSQINPGVIETLEGGNSRLPILGWYCFKWYGLFFSFIFGYLMAYSINSSLFRIPRGLIGTSVYAAIYIGAISFATDPLVALSQLFSIAIFILLLNIILKILSGYNITFFKLRI